MGDREVKRVRLSPRREEVGVCREKRLGKVGEKRRRPRGVTLRD